MTGLESSPIFDGSETSLSGNGAYVANQSDVVLGAGEGLNAVYLPAGNGGGCVTSGPFANMTVNLGPVALDEPGGIEVSNKDGVYAYNPRCLKRDLVGLLLGAPYMSSGATRSGAGFSLSIQSTALFRTSYVR